MPMNSLDQFKASGMDYLVRKGLFEDSLFKNDKVMLRKKVYVPNYPNASVAYNYYIKPLEVVAENPEEYIIIGAGYESFINKYYMDIKGEHNFHVSKDTVFMLLGGLFFNKSSLYQHEFSMVIMEMRDFGIIQYLDKLYSYKSRLKYIRKAREENRTGQLSESDKMHLVHLTGGFFILGCGFILAIIFLILEYIMSEEWMGKRIKVCWKRKEKH